MIKAMPMLLFVFLVLPLASCAAVKRTEEPQTASATTSVDMNLPDRSGLKAAVPDIEAKMNAYHLVIAPVDPSCAKATSLDQLDAYVNSAKISATLTQGCDYDVTLALGHRPAADQAAQVVSYEGKVKALISAQCLKCHNSGGTKPELATYDDVTAVGDLSVQRVAQGKMPIGATLSADDKALFAAWQKADFLEKDPPPPDTTKLAETYYVNDKPLRVTKEQIEGQASLRVSLPLKLQADGGAIGLGK